MRKFTLIVLLLALIISNVLWLSYLGSQRHWIENLLRDLRDSRQAQQTVMKILPNVVGRPLSRDEVTTALTKSGIVIAPDPINARDIHAGGVLFSFDENGTLVQVVEPSHFRD